MAGGRRPAGPGKARAGVSNREKADPTEERQKPGFKGDGVSWPVLTKRHLDSQFIRELRGLDLFSVPGLLSAKECESFIECAERLGFQQQGSLGPKYGEAFRDNGRVSVHSPSIADNLWGAGLSSLFQAVTVNGKRAIGLNPNIRFYRYMVGQRFGQHVDENADVGGGQQTQYTLLVYLTGGELLNSEKSNKPQLLGGETVFYDKRRVVAEVAPVTGMALLHIHGARCLLHEAKVVSEGIKYVLRSDVVFG